jgi:hypothetical protein
MKGVSWHAHNFLNRYLEDFGGCAEDEDEDDEDYS